MASVIVEPRQYQVELFHQAKDGNVTPQNVTRHINYNMTSSSSIESQFDLHNAGSTGTLLLTHTMLAEEDNVLQVIAYLDTGTAELVGFAEDLITFCRPNLHKHLYIAHRIFIVRQMPASFTERFCM